MKFEELNLDKVEELRALIGIKQNPQYHAEGDVYIHTLMTINSAKLIAEREKLNDHETNILLFSALCHDFGKAVCSRWHDEKIIAYGHEQESVRIARDFLSKLEIEPENIEIILKLIDNHGIINQLYKAEIINNEKVSLRALKRLIKRIEPAKLEMLQYLSEADARGRISEFSLIDNSDDYLPKSWLLKKLTNE